MSYPSNFESNFNGNLSNLDILTSVSDSITMDTTTGHTYKGRYFYIGNLLIQFADYSSGIPDNSSKTDDGGSYTIDFPISYSSTPYTVVVCPANKSGSNLNAYVTLTEQSHKDFKVHIGNNNSSFSWVAIGPRSL